MSSFRNRFPVPALLCGCLRLFAVNFVLVEGEDATAHSEHLSSRHHFVSRHPALSGGVSLGGQGIAGETWAEFTLNVPEAGDYGFYVRKFWHHGPFRWRFGDGEWRSLDRPALIDNTSLDRIHMNINWVHAGRVQLPAGEITLRLEQTRDGPFVIDCLILTREPFFPRGALKPGERSGIEVEGFFTWEPEADTFDGTSVLDLRHLNEAEAGIHGPVRRQGDLFVLGDGSPVRFWMVQADLRNMEPHQIDRWARRLAAYGVNMVRMNLGSFFSRRVDQDAEAFDRELAQLRLSSPTPPSDLPERRLACLQTPIPETLAHTWKLEALEMVALDGEMMPAFQDRLARMGAGPPSLPPPLRTPAAAALLTEDDLLEVLLVLGLREARMLRKDWKLAHQHLKDRADLIDPHQTAASIPHMWRAATLLAEGPEPTQALPWLEKIHQQDRDHKGARFLLGALKAEDHPQEAATWLRPLAANDFFYGSDAADLLLNLAALRGDTAEVQHLQQKLDPFFVRLADAVEERGKAPTRKTLFLDPMIPPDLRASMVKEIHQLGKIKEVLIVRTEVTEFPETPAYYVSIAYRGLVTRQQALEDKVLTCLQDHLPGTCRVLTSEEAGWRRRMRKSPGAALYNRRKEKAAQRQ